MASPWVWFDFENTPHVLFLEPLIRAVSDAGWPVRITAKPQSQTLGLAAARSLAVEVVGSGGLTGVTRKLIGGLSRGSALAGWALRHGRPALLVSSSRTATLAALLLRIPSIALLDYEHVEHRTLAMASRSLWMPDLLQGATLPRRTRRVVQFYQGLKENLYLDSMTFDRSVERAAIGVAPAEYCVIARTPADTAHYAAELSDRLWTRAVDALLERGNVRIIVLPRTTSQLHSLETRWRGNHKVRIQTQVVSGPNLVAAADLVLGGGGTMNREAAVLGVPVWSMFTGPPPQIDENLSREGRLRWVRSEDELASALSSERPERSPPRAPFPAGKEAIVRDIKALLEQTKIKENG